MYEAILSSARELGAGENDAGNDLVDIPLLHVAYSRVQSRLRCLSRIIQVHPSVVPKLGALLREKMNEMVRIYKYFLLLQISLKSLSNCD